MALPTSVCAFTEAGRVVGARLFDFATGSATLLPGHRDWIRDYFVPKLKQCPNAWVDFIGFASRRGDANLNLRLSQQRIQHVETYIKSLHPGIKINLRIPRGENAAEEDNTADGDNWGYYRAVLIRWYGVPLPIPAPDRPPPPPPVKPEWRTRKPPKGWWVITDVSNVGFTVGISVGVIKITVVNWNGDWYEISGFGWGGGPAVEVKTPEFATLVQKVLYPILNNLGSVPGDLKNWLVTQDDLKAPSSTGGCISRGLSRTSNMSIADITANGWLTVISGGFHLLIGGGDLGVISFTRVMDASDVVLPPMEAYHILSRIPGSPWGVAAGAGMATFKASAGITFSQYKITSVKRTTAPANWEYLWVPPE